MELRTTKYGYYEINEYFVQLLYAAKYLHEHLILHKFINTKLIYIVLIIKKVESFLNV